ncbi:MAG TPA: hypothetical protein VMG58_06085 [Candidatus Sulfotelmatobacter sp.]|nr:hypothetical protein [Candidatus Sulfotelmatobacter sp.]
MRYRFTDRILELDHGAASIRTCKTFPRTEDYFAGPFRTEAEVPFSLVLESMASSAAIFLIIRSGYRVHPLLLKINRARSSRPVRAGDRMTVEARITATQGDWIAENGSSGTVQARVRSRVGEDVVGEAELLYFCLPMAWTLGAQMPKTVREIQEVLDLVDDPACARLQAMEHR